MKRKEVFRPAMLAIALFILQSGQAQVSVGQNTPANPGSDYVGWDNTTTVPLQIRHDGIYPIEFYTSGSYRGQINPNMSYAIGTAPSAPRNGFMLLSGRDNFTQNAKGPFTRLHLVDDVGSNSPIVYAQDIGYRQWMRNGITFTGNSDQAYLGQKYSGNDNTDFVIQWSDNPNGSPWGTDRMKFIFSSQFTGAHTGMGSENGLEAVRLWPKNADEVNVGVGDFFAGNILDPVNIIDPTERLDVLNGRLRIRQLPDDPEVDGAYKVMVVDASASPSAERGVVKWIDPASLPGGGGGCGSGWSLQGNNACTAWDGNPCIPQDVDNVGIGTDYPTAKLDIYKVASPSTNSTALRSTLIADIGVPFNYAVDAMVSRHSPLNKAIRAYGFDADRTYGIDALADGPAANYGVWSVGKNGMNNYGVNAFAKDGSKNVGVNGSASGGTSYNIAIWGTASGANALAGFFDGDVYTTGSYLPSDAMLKTNVQALEGGLDLVMSLEPKTYDYLTEEFPQMHLPTGQQAGVIAESLANALPGLVRTMVQPSVQDTLGNLVSDEVEFSAVNYTGLIPYLIDAIQEQQATIAELQAQIAQCCATQGGGMAPQGAGGTRSAAQEAEDLQEERLLVQPNPFTDHATLRYWVPKSGKVSLQVSGSDGRVLGTLREEQADAGAYSYEWNTGRLAPGTYFCALLVDGNVVVKRAVKVAR